MAVICNPSSHHWLNRVRIPLSESSSSWTTEQLLRGGWLRYCALFLQVTQMLLCHPPSGHPDVTVLSSPQDTRLSPICFDNPSLLLLVVSGFVVINRSFLLYAQGWPGTCFVVQAGLNSKQSSCHDLLSAKITGLCNHADKTLPFLEAK